MQEIRAIQEIQGIQEMRKKLYNNNLSSAYERADSQAKPTH